MPGHIPSIFDKDLWQHATHPEIEQQPEQVVEFLTQCFMYRWRRRPRDMSYHDTPHLKHIGEAINYLRRQLDVSREQMAMMLCVPLDKYTNLERLGSPIQRATADRLKDLCKSHGMEQLARYFGTYMSILAKKKGKNGDAGKVVPTIPDGILGIR